MVTKRLRQGAFRIAPAAMAKEERIGRDLLGAHRCHALFQQMHVRLGTGRTNTQSPAPAPLHRRFEQGNEAVECRDQGRGFRDEAQGHGQLPAIPVHRFGLAAEGIERLVIEIGRSEARIPLRGETPGPVVEALARDVDIVGIEYAVNEACDHPCGCQISAAFHYLMHQHYRGIAAPRCIVRRVRAGKLFEAVGDQRLHVLRFLQRGQPLESADPDMAVRQPHHDG